MLQNATVTNFTVFELLGENQQQGLKLLPTPRLGLSAVSNSFRSFRVIVLLKIDKVLRHSTLLF